MLIACDTDKKNFLDFSGTADLARDINFFREQTGHEKINMWVVSYGTIVGSTYATLFPDHIDKLVLDSTLPPVRCL